MTARTDKSDPREVKFCWEYWQWLRGESALEPIVQPSGLTDDMADVLRRQCDIEFRHHA